MSQQLVLQPHQRRAANFMISHPFAGIWLDIGGQKTASTLAALMEIRPAGHILVIAPVPIARSTWIDEIAKWGLPIRTRSLIVDERDRKLSKADRLARFAETLDPATPPTMWFINQELLTQSARSSCPVCGGAPRKDRRPCPECQNGLVDQMPRQRVNGTDHIMWPFPTVIIDEAQGFKSHTSIRFKALAAVRPAISRLIELSGTPSPNGLHDLWSQIYLLDQGRALGRTITEFRNRWFTPRLVPGTTVPARWVANPGAETAIHNAVSHLVMSDRNADLHLPERLVVNDTVRLPAPVMDAYTRFKKELVIDLVTSDPESGARSVDQIVAANQAVLQAKLSQFASGTLYTGDPDDPGTRGNYDIIHTQKLEMTSRLIEQAGAPVLLAYHFRSDREQLLKRLTADGFGPQAFDGSREMVRAWNAGEIRVMLLHPASGGPGLNLQAGGHTLIWYTLPFSLEHYMQTNGRLHRPGQTHPVTIHRIIARGTVDERMPGVLSGKRNIQASLLDAVSAELADDLAGIGPAAA